MLESFCVIIENAQAQRGLNNLLGVTKLGSGRHGIDSLSSETPTCLDIPLYLSQVGKPLPSPLPPIMSMKFLHYVFFPKKLNFGLSTVLFLFLKAGVRNQICEELRVLLFIEELSNFVKAQKEKDAICAVTCWQCIRLY